MQLQIKNEVLALEIKNILGFGKTEAADLSGTRACKGCGSEFETKELMENLSLVRFGSVAGKLNVPIETVNELMISMQPATINVMAGKRLEERERDMIRAKTVREKLG